MITRRTLLALLACSASPAFGQGISTRSVKPQPRGKPSGRPFNARFTDVTQQGSTLTDMVVENLMLERRQIAAYTALIREIGDGDPTTRRILTTILEVTEKHASELADYLKRTADVSPR